MIHFKTIVSVLYVGSILFSYAAGEDSTEKASEPEYIKRFHDIQKTTEEKQSVIHENAMKKIDPAKGYEAQKELIDRFGQQLKKLSSSSTKKVFLLVEDHVTEPAAAEPLAWIAMQDSTSDLGRSAAELLTEHHLVHPKTVEFGARLSRNSSLAENLLRSQLASPDLPQNLKWKVMLSLARVMQSKAVVASRLEDMTDGETNRYLQAYGKERFAALKNSNAEELEEEAIKLFEEIELKYPDEEFMPGLTAGDFAKSSIFAIKNLRVGKQAPDIVGEDLDDEPIKLSDFRGKVVLLTFWGTWCGPCMAKIPQECELVDLYKEKPFAIVGVNSDSDKAKLPPVLAEYNITWRSFWCGPQGPLGPIPMAWNISGWPTTYVIDHAGVIRGKQLSDAALDVKVAELVTLAEREITNRERK